MMRLFPRLGFGRHALESIEHHYPPFESVSADGKVGDDFSNAWMEARKEQELDFLIVVTTCQRTASLSALLKNLFSAAAREFGAQSRRFALLVIEDVTDTDYGRVRQDASGLFGERLLWLRSTRRMGKRGYYRTYQAALRVAQMRNPAQTFFVQDDVEIGVGTIAAARRLFRELKLRDNVRHQPQVLNLFAADDDEVVGRWIWFARRVINGLPARQTQWFDLNAFLVERKVLEELNYEMIPISDKRWRFDSTLSSGVGQQLTKRLKRSAVTYQCYPPLAFHGAESSVMNPRARIARPLDNRHLRALTIPDVVSMSEQRPSGHRRSATGSSF